jgi:hypothetical protein
MKKPKSKRRTKRMDADRMQVVYASNEEVKIILDGTSYIYQFTPPDHEKLATFTRYFCTGERGRALNYLKRNAHHTLPWTTPIHETPRKLREPFTRGGPYYKCAVVPPELEASPNIKLTIALPAEIGHQFLRALDERGGNIHDFVRLCAKARMRANKDYDVGDELAFGKYIGERIETVIANDPGYVNWILQNTNSLILSDRLTNMLEESYGASTSREIPF